jgi:hypothetical protein
VSRQTRRRRGRREAPTVETVGTDARPLTPVERARLRQRYAVLRCRSVELGFATLGIVVRASTPEDLVGETDAVIAEATRSQQPS